MIPKLSLRGLMPKDVRKSYVRDGFQDPAMAFITHNKDAARRDIEFKMTFDEWWGMWKPHWENRGKKALQVCMCRYADKGAYEVGNVRIATNKENNQERALEYRISHAQRKFRKPLTSQKTAVVESMWAAGKYDRVRTPDVVGIWD